MRYVFQGSDPKAPDASGDESPLPFTIYIAAGPGRYNPLPGVMNLKEVTHQHWTWNKPLELFYAYKVKPTTSVDNMDLISSEKTW